MLTPPLHPQENQRIKTLQSLNVLDTPPEERLDRLTNIISNMFTAPIAIISLIDTNRQWFKSCVGLDVSETARDISFCGHAILQEHVFVINDALEDQRFADNPLVTGEPKIRFYAGCPLLHPNGMPLGTLCIIDREPRQFGEDDLKLLKEIATLVELELVQQQSATMDTETQLTNKEGFMLLGEHSIKVCRRLDLQVTVAFLYAKGLLNLNNQPELYKRALTVISQQFHANFRSSDIVARYETNNFVALMTNTDEQTASETLQKVIGEIATTLERIDENLTIELVTGSTSSHPNVSLDKLLLEAFIRLHE